MEEKENITNTSVTEIPSVNNATPEAVHVSEEKKPKKKKKKTSKIILNVITFILFVVIVLEAAIGIVNMQRISNKEEPIWYLSTKKTETELKTVTEYHLVLSKSQLSFSNCFFTSSSSGEITSRLVISILIPFSLKFAKFFFCSSSKPE